MAIAYFSSFAEGETIEVEFSKPQGGEVKFRLLVDSGFTGQSCFVLPEGAESLAQAPALASEAAGALHGMQTRVVVLCRIAELSFQVEAIAILADVAHLSLPAGVQGLVGLRFLRYFRRWGAEQSEDGGWRFFLATDKS
jgi:hypothetical protein